MDLDTGDIIAERVTRIVHMVACYHDPIIHTAGFPELRLRTCDVELVRKATDAERKAHLEAMASSSSQAHRASCARSRIQPVVTDEYGYE